MPKKYLTIVLFVMITGVFSRAGATHARTNEVVVYVSEDQVFSEPILKDFEKDTGIKVKALYDTEEAKSTGVMNRLLAEKNNPQADVYWANEPMRAEYLKQAGISEAYISPGAKDIPDNFKDPGSYWTGFSARARVFIVNKSASQKPHSVADYADARFKSKTILANPLFGTTTTQIAALFTLWGDEKGTAFMNNMKENDVKLSTSNGESADLVASGNFDFSLVDSDDVFNRIKQGKPVEIVYPDQGENELGTLIVPNAVLLIKGSPNSQNGKKLVDYLLSRETERKLAFADCVQIPLNPGVETPPEIKTIHTIKVMKINYAEVAKKTKEIQPFLKEWAG